MRRKDIIRALQEIDEDTAVKLGIIEKSGAWFTVEGQRLQGRDNVKQCLADNEEIANAVEAKIREAMAGKKRIKE